MRHWLVKSEADVYGIDDLMRDGQTMWDGVRNYTARNTMRDDMKPGDLVLFYHSQGDPPGVAGIARVASAPYADPTQFDPASAYYDEKSTPEVPRWQLVDIAFVERFPAEVPLPALKADPALQGMELLRRGSRLSVQPVSEAHFERVVALGRG